MSSSDESTDTLTGAADREWEGFVGATFPGLYAMIAQDYMHKYHMTREQLAQVAVKNHYNGARNPIAQFQQRDHARDRAEIDDGRRAPPAL